MEAWLGLIGAISGGVVAWALNEVTKVVRDRQEADKQLRKAAFVCLDRLLKIQDAENGSREEQRDAEIHFLGKDMDQYRDSIANSSNRRRAPHWKIYQEMVPILLKHELTELSTIISNLEKLSGVGSQERL